jgi:hypothetical protein
VILYAEDSSAPARLAAYFTSDSRAAAAGLGSFLATRLPRHMLPAFYEHLPEFPLTLNGKIDRAALPTPRAGSQPETGIALEANQLERVIADTWSNVLNAGSVSLEANFFEIGGTSLLLIAARSALEHRLKRSIPVTFFFEHPTIRSLATRLAAPENATASDALLSDQLESNARRQRAAFARARSNRSIA